MSKDAPLYKPTMSSLLRDLANDIPQRDDSSFGILTNESMNQFDPDGIDMSLSAQLQEARSQARDSITRATKLSGIPSRLLKRSEISSNTSDGLYRTDSTINESDLFPGDSSTPRASSTFNLDNLVGRKSVGQELLRLGESLGMHSRENVDKIMDDVQNTLGFNSSLFQSGDAAKALLMADELSWNREKNLTAELKEISIGETHDLGVSMGSFFQGRSDLPSILGRSPERAHPATPLIDETGGGGGESLSLSAIQRVLSETSNTPNKALDMFMNYNNKKMEVSTIEYDEKDKENRADKSVASLRSSSSLSSLPNGKLPISTTRMEIIWGCIKPGKNSSQEFVIKNKSTGRIRIQCAVSNPAFRLIKDRNDLEFSSSIKFVLHAYETKSVTVIFAPTKQGAASDLVSFTSLDSHHQQTVRQCIRLFGYGGSSTVTLDKIPKDITGKFILSLGVIDTGDLITRSFWVKNTGTLAAFACVKFLPQGLHSFSSIALEPEQLVLQPEESREVIVSFLPKKEDFDYIKNKMSAPVVDLGKITLIHGTEPDRGRLRRLCLKAREQGLDVEAATERLIARFPGESMPADLAELKESPASVGQILRLCYSKDIVVILEQDLDSTLTGQFRDETSMFQSLCMNESQGLDETLRKGCTVEPASLILFPPGKDEDLIFLNSERDGDLFYQVVAPEGVQVSPAEGVVAPGKTAVVRVRAGVVSKKTVHKVRILVNGDSFEVDVKVVCV